MAEKEEKVVKFIWKVVNYSYCWNKTGDFLKSPDFKMDVFEGSSWCLKLYPRGVSSYERYVSVHLERLESSGGPLGITVDYEIALLRTDGRAEYVKETKDRCFRKGHAFGFDNLAVREDILGTKKSTLLPEDILSVQCRIFPKGATLKTSTEIIAKSRLELERSVFLWEFAVRDDCSPINAFAHYRLPIPNTKYYMTLKIYLPHNCYAMGIYEHRNAIKSMHYKVGILDSNRSVSWVVKDEQTNSTDLAKILQIDRDEILKQKSLYLPNNTLSLHCDFTFSFGIQHSHIEKVLYEDALTFAPASRRASSETDTSPKKYSYHCTDSDASFKSDFQNLYQEGALCDFTLTVGNENIRAHKVVLAARSLVFKAMLSSNMKENEKNMVDISDLDANTVRRMLTFIYTDTTDDLDWDTASKLYFAADKYGITKLKRICSDFLQQNLSVSNVGEILSLAHLHGDEELKNLTLEFISSHDTEVICSMEWKAFMAEEALLAAETMRYIFMKKAENNRGKT